MEEFTQQHYLNDYNLSVTVMFSENMPALQNQIYVFFVICGN